MAKIFINRISIDPERQAPALASANLTRSDSSTSNYILIQTNQQITTHGSNLNWLVLNFRV
jgi:hypothetical protein